VHCEKSFGNPKGHAKEFWVIEEVQKSKNQNHWKTELKAVVGRDNPFSKAAAGERLDG
jgi:hypothetical protein